MKNKIENWHVILVDDAEEEHLLFRKALGALPGLSINLVCLSSARELQDYLEYAEGLPHMVFLDMYMPEKNGLECLCELRASQKFKEILVSMYSVSSAGEVVTTCLAAGANIYITKPGDFKALTARLREVIKSCMHYHSMSMSFDTFVKCL